MSKNCLKCGKKLNITEGKCTYGYEYVCNECYELIEKEHQNDLNRIEENTPRQDENQKDIWHRAANAYSHIAKTKGKW